MIETREETAARVFETVFEHVGLSWDGNAKLGAETATLMHSVLTDLCVDWQHCPEIVSLYKELFKHDDVVWKYVLE